MAEERTVAESFPGSRRAGRATRIAALVLASLALPLAGCGGGGAGPQRLAPGTPVILISVDTLRADRLPAYGYAATQTPAIDRLASDGVVFENAYSHSPLTLPSHVSLLTGLLPVDHRIRDNIGYPLDAREVPLLQRSLKGAGYATGGFVSSFVLRRASGIAAGFDAYDDGIRFDTGGSLALLQRPGPETLARATAWIDGVAAQPFLLFFHIYEPHTPYAPPEPFASRYASAYDGEVAAADAVVGRLLARLEEAGLYDRSLILLLSDHGEGLGEHGEQEHGVFLYRTTLHVPLLLKLPGSELGGSRVAATVQLADVFPTIVSLLGLEPDSRLAGDSLMDVLRGEVGDRPVYAETFYPRLHFGWSELFSVVRGRHHLIDAPEPELFDLLDDPGETTNLASRLPGLRSELEGELQRHDRGLEPPEAIPAETRRSLAALGYVGALAPETEGPLPDPKGRVESLQALRLASGLVGEGACGKAEPLLRRLADDEPQMLDAWDQLAHCLDRLGRTSEALAVYQDALARFPGTPLLSLSAAQLEFRLGRLDRAALLAEAAAPVDPAAAQALLSQIALHRGDLGEAERRARLALEAEDSRPGPELARADVLIAAGRQEDALAALDSLEQRLAGPVAGDPALARGIQFLRGKALASLGRAGEAERAFMLEIERFPLDPRAYTHLAAMYGLLDMRREAVVVVGKLLQVNSSPYAVGEAIKALDLVGARDRADRLAGQARVRYPDDPFLQGLIAARGAARRTPPP